MNILDEPPDAPRSRSRLIVAVGTVLLVIAALAGVWLLPRHDAPAPSAPTHAAPPPAAVAVAPPVTTTAPVPVPTRRRPAKVKDAPAPVPAAPAAVPTLKVDSDVPGASVFVDRVYLGTTPLATSDVKPGSHALRVSAEGYEGQASTVDVGGGPADIMVRFKVVRLNEGIPVVHKHAIGSCEGRLVADPHGLRYETPNKGHAFAVPFSEVRSLEIDYLQKNLRLTRKDGKTFNFTDHTANGDALFVFHQKVEAARAKLAAGLPPAEK